MQTYGRIKDKIKQSKYREVLTDTRNYEFGSYASTFFLDAREPTQMLMLKRAPAKRFAPNFYTGVGGALEEGETALQAAARELEEETGLKEVKLFEVARTRINNKKTLHYFSGILDSKFTPHCDEGILQWVGLAEIFRRKIIPDTERMLREWQRRDFVFDRPFRMDLAAEHDQHGMAINNRIEKISEGLK